MAILVSLLLAFLSIGLVSFGGGYAMLPLFERVVVHENEWLSMTRFVDMIAISQVTPGPIAINSATFIGYQTEGILGSLVATAGVIGVPVVLVLCVVRFDQVFQRSRVVFRILSGLRPALVGLILASVASVSVNAIVDWRGPIIVAVLLVLLVKTRVHPIAIIVLSGMLGMLVYG